MVQTSPLGRAIGLILTAGLAGAVEASVARGAIRVGPATWRNRAVAERRDALRRIAERPADRTRRASVVVLAAIESTGAARQAKICRAPALVRLFAALAQTLACQAASVRGAIFAWRAARIVSTSTACARGLPGVTIAPCVAPTCTAMYPPSNSVAGMDQEDARACT